MVARFFLVGFLLLDTIGFIPKALSLGRPSPRNADILLGAAVKDNDIADLNALLTEGIKLYRAGNIKGALDLFQKALTISRQLKNQAGEANSLLGIGLMYSILGQNSPALDAYGQALIIQRRIQDRSGEGTTINNIGLIYQNRGQNKLALDNYNQALVIAREVGDRPLEGTILNNIGLVYQNGGQYREALDYYDRALTIMKEVQNPYSQITTLNNMGLIYQDLGQYPQALEYYNRSLELVRTLGDRLGEGRTLNNIGEVYRITGQYREALDYYNRSLTMIKEVGERTVEGAVLNNIGLTYHGLGSYKNALDYYDRSLKIRREVNDRPGESRTLNNIGEVYRSTGEYDKALNYYGQALVILKEIGDRSTEGTVLNNTGLVYQNTGRYDEALKYYDRALIILREVGARPIEARTLNNIGEIYRSSGKYREALDYYQQALGIIKEIGDRPIEGLVLNNIGLIYQNLGQYGQALDYYQQALGIVKQVGDRPGEGTVLNNMARIYHSLQRYPDALEYYEQSLKIVREVGDRSGEGTALNNIGLVYQDGQQYAKALDYYRQALIIVREIGDRPIEGTILNNMGLVYQNLGKSRDALDYYGRALTVIKEVGDRPTEAITLNNIGYVLEERKQPQLAIIFFKQAVNVFEGIRDNISSFSREQRESYTETVESTYRHLADLLLQQDRIVESNRVLDLLKVRELEDYLQDVRGNDNTAKGIPNLEAEKPVTDDLNRILALAVENGRKLDALNGIQKRNGSLTPAQEKDRIELIKAQEKITDNFNDFIESDRVQNLVEKLNRETRGAELADELDKLLGVQDDLKNLNAVLLYPLILDDRIELILTTPYAPPIRRTVKVSKLELNRAIVAFRESLRSPATDATKPALQLYNWLIAPVKKDIEAAKVTTILYAPDGMLRYVPLAALYDGKNWLIENYRINNITAYSLTDFTRKNADNIKILAGAFVSGNYSFQTGGENFKFSGLKYAGIEVKNLARTVPGTIELLDGAFNPDNTIRQMNAFTVIHLATHAAVVVGKAEDSFILFGNGTPVTLRDVRKWSLRGVDLVVLSACETGLGGIKDGSGAEILGLGYQIERAGAKSVIASLWSVNDGGTQLLMNRFYNNLAIGKMSKAEALQRAQIDMIRGNETLLTENRGLRVQGIGENLQGKIDHPFYWAPFILIGNGL